VHTPLRKILPHGYEFGSTPSSSNLSSLLADFQQQDLPVKYYFLQSASFMLFSNLLCENPKKRSKLCLESRHMKKTKEEETWVWIDSGLELCLEQREQD
jgi:hypothetical protein